MFKDRLYSIKHDLEKHRRNPEYVIEESINNRLKTSLLNYIDELTKSYSYISDKDSINVMKNIIRKG